MNKKSVALDGPSGAGKSTLAKMTASHFGFVYVDTGALYRCIGHYALSNGVSPDDAEGVKLLLPLINLEMSHDGEGTQRMILNGEDITAHIRSPETSMAASTVSAMPAVRAFLLSMQREMAERYDVVMDGRDIGTVVLPQAGLKVFLTAKPETRAHRRYLELLEKGVETTLDEVLRDLNLRDKNDSEREAAPLRPAEGAIMLDTTEMSLDESFEALCSLIEQRYGG